MSKCYFCEAECTATIDPSYRDYYECPNCGSYYLYGGNRLTFSPQEKRLVASYLFETNRTVRHEYINDPAPRDVNHLILDEIARSGRAPKTLMDKLQKLLLFLYGRSEYFGQKLDIHTTIPYRILAPAAWACNRAELEAMLNELGALNWIKINDPFEIGVSLNPVYRLNKIDLGLVGEVKFVEFINSNILAHPFTIVGMYADRGPWISFNVVPYVSTRVIAGASAWAGLQIRGQPYAGFKGDDGKSWKTLYQWSIPIGIACMY